jgi:hypothetical protein
MAQGGKEHRMFFDLQRGRRRTTVKVVYAILAVLMGLSLFLVVGSFNIAELFSSNGSSGSSEIAKPYEEQAERLEAKLKEAPEDQALPAVGLPHRRQQLALERTGRRRPHEGLAAVPDGELLLVGIPRCDG